MSGSLILINEATASSSASLTLTGIDSTYNVYKVVGSNLRPNTAGQLEVRLTKGGTPQTDSEYDWAYKNMYTGGSYVNEASTNQDSFFLYSGYEETTGKGRGNGLIMYLFNFPEADEFSFFSVEQTRLFSTDDTGGNQGGCVHTVASASDGVQIFFESGRTLEEGTLKLYGLKK